ncbi:FUSC family protein [Legionella nagasakiensis]|uniref:FUSC family protein n=1 Tax=Legionella nagasakiensis TaxID=535290 RepID=UPI0010551F39|nr:FUSC family protein [Legionella nagasakiensis]
MQHALALKKRLEYARFSHLLILFVMAIIMYAFSTLPHKWWIFLTILVISSGVEPGLIIRRSIHRIGGTLLALLFLIPLLYLLQLNYRLIPVFFILAVIGMVVASLNPGRYDICVFFITLVVFLLVAQTVEVVTPEGPVEMVLNRGICTVIGIMIVIAGDYFLFHAYRYSQRLYLFHQLQVYGFLRDIVPRIEQAHVQAINGFQFVEKLRNEMTEHFAPIAISSENLKLDLKVSAAMKQQVEAFQETIWEIRRLVFALCFSEVILPSPIAASEHLHRYHQLMAKAHDALIRVER